MLRFLSRRRARLSTKKRFDNRFDGQPALATGSGAGGGGKVSKNLLQCRVLLLDGSDISVDLTVRIIVQSYYLVDMVKHVKVWHSHSLGQGRNNYLFS